MSRWRAHCTTLRRWSTPRTLPVGLDGEFTNSSAGRSGPSWAVPSARTGRAPASSAPTSYVGYATSGITTVSPAPMPSMDGSCAMASLVPITGRIAFSGSPTVLYRRLSAAAAASRSSTVPIVAG